MDETLQPEVEITDWEVDEAWARRFMAELLEWIRKHRKLPTDDHEAVVELYAVRASCQGDLLRAEVGGFLSQLETMRAEEGRRAIRRVPRAVDISMPRSRKAHRSLI